MANVIINIALRDGQPNGGILNYTPGQTVRGSVEITPGADFNCKHVYIRLEWHTEGRGDRDQQHVAQVDVFQGTLAARIPRTFDFALALPHEPWSYAGHYVNIVWAVVVDIDVAWAVNPKQNQPFVMAPASPL